MIRHGLVRRAGEVFRLVQPRWSKAADVLNGSGALNANGRWHTRGINCVCYTAFSPETALAESLASARYFGIPVVGRLPVVMVGLRFELSKVLDLTIGRARQRLRMAKRAMVRTDWRKENRNGTAAITQTMGGLAFELGVEAIITPSAADKSGSCLVVFPENLVGKSIWRLHSEVKWGK